MEIHMTKRPTNPAKAFLSRYKYLCARQESLQRAIQAANDRALSCTVRLKPIHTQGGGGAYDRLAEDIAGKVDAEAQLRADLKNVNAALQEIRAAINSLQSEAQKTILTLRYIEGLEWAKVAERMNYEISMAYILHGRALRNVERWMQEKRL